MAAALTLSTAEDRYTMTIRTRKGAVALFSASLALLAPGAFAHTAAVHHAAHHPNVIQRHPTATGAAAGVATHTMLKHSAANKKAHHQKLNFAEKHPTLSGLGVAIGTRHEIKKHTAH